MTRETYLRNRKVFEMRYEKAVNNGFDVLGLVDLRRLRKGFRNFTLFLNIYAKDRLLDTACGVSSINRYPPVIVDGTPVKKVRLNLRGRNMVERYPEFYEKAHALCLKNLTK